MAKTISNQELDKYLNEWRLRHKGYERRMYRPFKAALDEQIKPVIEEIKRRGVDNLESVLPMLISREPMQKAYQQCYVKIGAAQAQWQHRKIKALVKASQKASPFAFFSERWKKLMQSFYESESSQKIVNVTETTIKRVQEILSRGRDMDLTTSRLADYMVTELSRPDFNRNRALRIARTESTVGANKGASLAAADSDYKLVKKWISVIDGVTRQSHIEANGQTVNLDEKFTVGGHECDRPGDPDLPAKEVIQCRCTVAYIPYFDSDGLPVLRNAA